MNGNDLYLEKVLKGWVTKCQPPKNGRAHLLEKAALSVLRRRKHPCHVAAESFSSVAERYPRLSNWFLPIDPIDTPFYSTGLRAFVAT
jgi:hypothetical protein